MAKSFVVVAASLVLAAVGCLGTDSVDCPGGGVCPQGLVCRLDRGEQICALSTCGNGIMDSGESCDDGNTNSGDRCPGDCVALPMCGNGERELGEECDDGNVVSGDGCQSTCLLPVRPPGRQSAAMAYDSARHELVMFGGVSSADLFGDTWEWNGLEWSQRLPSPPLPPPRQGAAMTYDAARGRIVMFGGYADPTPMVPLADTWEWDGVAWSERAVAVHPPGGFALMAFDANRDVTVLVNMTETWEWDGGAWAARPGGLVPMAMPLSLLAYHDAERATVLVDGTSPMTLRRDGIVWSPWPTTPPPMLLEGGMAYDRARGRMVVVGARGSDTELWELEGETWTQRTDFAEPPTRSGARVAYVDGVGILRFGGQGNETGVTRWNSDLWAWDGSAWRELQ